MTTEGRWYPALVISLGLVFLAGGSLLMLIMLGTVLGPFSVDAIRPPEMRERPAGAVWLSPSEGLSEAERALELEFFRARVPAQQALVAIQGLDELEALGVRALVLSRAASLTEREIIELESFVRSGGRAVALGWIGVWSENRVWRGPTRMGILLGGENVGIVPFDLARRLAVGAPGFLTIGLAPDSTLALANPAEAAGLTFEPGRGVALPELYWATPQAEPIDTAARASHLRPLGRGGLLWIGASASALHQTDEIQDRILGNALAWALRSATHGVIGSREAQRSLSTRLERQGPRRFELRVTRRVGAEWDDPRVRVFVHRPVRTIVVRNAVLLDKVPELQHRPGLEWFDLVLPELPIGSSRSYQLDVELRS